MSSSSPLELITTSPLSGSDPEGDDRSSAPCRFLVGLLSDRLRSCAGAGAVLFLALYWELCYIVESVGAEYLKIGRPRFEQR